MTARTPAPSVDRPDGRYTVVRPSLTQRLLVVVLLAAFYAVLLFPPDGSGDHLPLVVALPCGALIALAAWRTWAMRVELGPTVRITNFFRSLVLQWDEIAAFQYDDHGGGAHVLLADGRRPSLSGFGAGPRTLEYFRRQSRDAVRQMENRRKSRLSNRRGG